jgi:hypothetical protein
MDAAHQVHQVRRQKSRSLRGYRSSLCASGINFTKQRREGYYGDNRAKTQVQQFDVAATIMGGLYRPRHYWPQSCLRSRMGAPFPVRNRNSTTGCIAATGGSGAIRAWLTATLKFILGTSAAHRYLAVMHPSIYCSMRKQRTTKLLSDRFDIAEPWRSRSTLASRLSSAK